MRDAWLDLLLGGCCLLCRRPGRALCPACRATLPGGGFPVVPHPCPTGLAPSFAAGEYADPLRPLVLAHKERRAFALTAPLGDVLAGVVAAAVAATGVDGRVLLVPVPSRPAVVRARGHDPVRRMALRAASRCRRSGRDVRVLGLLRQRRRPADQAGLDAAARAANLHDTLAVVDRARRSLVRAGEPVAAVVCDDVLTTGATVREAQRALAESGVPVLAVACLAATRKRAADPLPFSQATG